MQPSIFVTRKLPDQAMDRLNELFDLEVDEDNRILDKEEIIKRAKDKDALLTLLTDRIDRDVLMSIPGLKVISNYAVGYDNIDIQAATEMGIPVCITPGVLTEATADCTLAMILGISRRIVESDRYVRSDKFSGWDPRLFLGYDVYGKTLGIVGMGRIGRAVARRAAGFGMQVLYTKNTPLPEEQKVAGSRHVDLDNLLKESDFVSLHIPMRPEVKHLIGKRELEMMKDTAFVINTARGAIINENELVKALRDKKIAGAALDVYEFEPDVNKDFYDLDNVLLLPHIGSATHATRIKMGIMAAENAHYVLNKQAPHALANPEVLK